MAAILKKNPLNCDNSAMVPSTFTKFGKVTHFGHFYPADRKNSEFLKPIMADGRHYEKPLNRHNSATFGRLIGTKFDVMTLLTLLNLATDKHLIF